MDFHQKIGVCIDIVEIWFGIANGQISLSAHDMSVFSFLDDNFSKCQWIFIKLGMCICIVEIWCRIADGQILSILDRVICPYFYFRMITLVNINKFSPNLASLGGSVGWSSDWESGGCRFNPRQVGNILSCRLIMKYFLWSFSPFC